MQDGGKLSLNTVANKLHRKHEVFSILLLYQVNLSELS